MWPVQGVPHFWSDPDSDPDPDSVASLQTKTGTDRDVTEEDFKQITNKGNLQKKKKKKKQIKKSGNKLAKR